MQKLLHLEDLAKYKLIWSEGIDEKIDRSNIKKKIKLGGFWFAICSLLIILVWIIERNKLIDFSEKTQLLLSFPLIVLFILGSISLLHLLVGLLSLMINKEGSVMLVSIGVYEEGIKLEKKFVFWNEIQRIFEPASWKINDIIVGTAGKLTGRNYGGRKDNGVVYYIVTKEGNQMTIIEDVNGFRNAISKLGHTNLINQ
jgi:hypothetical protein